ncbi:MAG: hypothetical protein P8166_03640 [Candidatus Thiodiazotropha sp.]
MRGRRSADISHAYEQNIDLFHLVQQVTRNFHSNHFALFYALDSYKYTRNNIASTHAERLHTTTKSHTVKIHRHILPFLLLTDASPAFARIGPAGTFGSTLEVLLMFAIVGGLIAGTLCALCKKHAYWKVLSLLSLAAVVITIWTGMFKGIPVIVFLAIFASASYLVRGNLIQERIAVMSTDGKPHRTKTGTAPNIMRWTATTYLFWAAFSLANIQLLGFLTIPPAVFLFPDTIVKFLPFILPPLVVALTIGAVTTAFIVRKLLISPYAAPLIFNICVLLAFFVSADIFRYNLMSHSLLEHNPNHLRSSSFLKSVLTYHTHFRIPHARFEENGKTYLWSYSERRFIQVPHA